MKTKAYVLISVVATAFVCACYPINVAPECRARANECLKGCPTSPSDLPGTERSFNNQDVRTDCERRCHEQCQSFLP